MALPTPADLKELAAFMGATVLNGEAIPTEYGTLTSSLDSNAKTITTTLVHAFTSDVDQANPDNVILTVV